MTRPQNVIAIPFNAYLHGR